MFNIQDLTYCIYSSSLARKVLIDEQDKLRNLIEISENNFNRQLAKDNYRLWFDFAEFVEWFPTLYEENKEKFLLAKDVVFIFCYDDELVFARDGIQLKFDI